MKELKNKGRQRWRDYICLFVSFLFVLYFGINYKSIIYNSHTLGNGIKILVLAGLWAIGTVLIFVKLEVKETVMEYVESLVGDHKYPVCAFVSMFHFSEYGSSYICNGKKLFRTE